MLQSVTRVLEMRVRGGRLYKEPYALEAGDIYELRPDYAQIACVQGEGRLF